MPILLVDCHNVAYSAFYSMGTLDYHGKKTGVIFGFLSQIFNLASTYETNKIVFCWDSKRSLRKQIFPAYKIKRQKELTPDEQADLDAMRVQLAEIRDEVLPSMGFSNILRKSGYEADDLLADLVINERFPNRWIEECPTSRLLVSSDKDLYQLLRSNVTIRSLRTRSLYTRDQFRYEYNISPSEWGLAKSIGGCDSDGVPGVPGFADPAHSPNGRTIQYIRGLLSEGLTHKVESPESRKIIERNARLVTLPFRLGITPDIKEDHLDRKAFINVFDRYGFESFLRKDALAKIERMFRL
jgi:hypothetical protein